MDNTWLELARDAYRAHDRDRAQELLTGYVRMHDQDPEGWFWLARCTEHRTAKTLYYRKALALRPDHAGARMELADLLSVVQPSVDAYSAPRPPVAPPESLVRAATARRRVHGSRFSMGRMAGIALFGLALMLATMVGLAVVPMFVGLRSFVIMSGSMEPTISTGSVAIAHPVSSHDLAVGDVIAFNPRPDSAMPTVHRIIQIEERQGVRYYTTRGDANTGDDAEMALPATGLQVVGAIPFAGYAVYYAAQPAGTVLLVMLPLLLLALLWVKDRVAVFRSLFAAREEIG